MKVFTLLLGYYSNRIPFYLYQIPDNSNLLFKLSDISTLFNVNELAHHPLLNHIPQGECYCQKIITGDENNNTNTEENNNTESTSTTIEYYVSVQALSRIALSMNKYRLAELCKLKPNDYSAGLADSILKNISTFEHISNQQFQSTEIPLLPTTSPLHSPKQHQPNNNNNNNNHDHDDNNNSNSNNNENNVNDHDHHDHEKDKINNNNHATQSPQAHPVKSEPLSPPPLRLSQPKETKDDQRNTNPMSLGKVLWSNGQGSQSPATRPHPDDDNTTSNKKQRTERKVLPKPAHTVSSQQVGNQHSYPNALNTLASRHGQTLLAKRQGKNSRHLTIFAPSYADHLSVAIRSAPLNSNFRNGQPLPPGTSTLPSQANQPFSQHQQQQQLHQQHHSHGQNNGNQLNTSTAAATSTSITAANSNSLHPGYHTSLRQPPKTATTLQPGHTLAPLLSPRAVPVLSSQHHGNSSHLNHHHHHHHHQQSSGHHHHLHHPEPKTTGGAIGKQEFAIPPIVPSQQQPPHTAHPHNASSSSFGRPHSTSHGYSSKNPRLDPQSNNNNNNNNNSGSGSGNNNNNNNNSSSSNNNNTSGSLPLTAAAAPMPPQTPTTFSFAALQRQQFLQPFEQLFDTIETTRTLKTTLDDQIRRSSTLLQTLQASSTTVEALIRSQIKEVQKDVMNRMDDLMDSMMKRITQLESRLEPNNDDENDHHHQQQHQHNNNNNRKGTSPPPSNSSEVNGGGSTHSSNLKSPPTIVRSQNDIGTSEYQSVLNTLRERLDRLEKSIG